MIMGHVACGRLLNLSEQVISMASEQSSASNVSHYHQWRLGLTALVIALTLFCAVVAIYSYRFPRFREHKDAQVVADESKTPGLGYVDTLLYIYDVGMAKEWLPNDRVWPTILLDNPQLTIRESNSSVATQKQLRRIVLDSYARTPLEARLISDRHAR